LECVTSSPNFDVTDSQQLEIIMNTTTAVLESPVNATAKPVQKGPSATSPFQAEGAFTESDNLLPLKPPTKGTQGDRAG